MASWRRYCCGIQPRQVVSGPLPPLFVLRSCDRHASNPLSLAGTFRLLYCTVLYEAVKVILDQLARIQVLPMYSSSLNISRQQATQDLSHMTQPLSSLALIYLGLRTACGTPSRDACRCCSCQIQHCEHQLERISFSFKEAVVS